MAHVYQRCSSPELGETDSLGYASAEDLNNTLHLPVIEHDGSDCEGYARAELLPDRTKDAFDQDSEGYARANFISGTADDVYGADSEGYARADFIPGTANDIYAADSEGYARADLFTDSGFGPVDSVIDGEGYARADHFINTLRVPAADHDGSDSEGYARIELSSKDPLLLGDITNPRDGPNIITADRTRSSEFNSVLDPLTKSSEGHRQYSQPDYMTLEETLHTEGNIVDFPHLQSYLVFLLSQLMAVS